MWMWTPVMQRIARIVLLATAPFAFSTCGRTVDPSLKVVYGNVGTYYPGDEIPCARLSDCDDYLAEVAGFMREQESGRGPASSVTLHGIVTADGDDAIITRSGGGTLIAVATFADGSRVAVVVGCGVGVAVERCASSNGPHSHDSDGPPR
jgi:hypothetical protein